MSNCNTCGSLFVNILGEHVCPPKWLVLDIDNHGDDWSDAETICAYDEEHAAEKAAEYLDDANGEGPCERTIHVKSPDNDEVKVFEISFDYYVSYSANELEATK